MKNNDDCFKNILNKYLIQLNCSAKELADASHVSTSIISRYRSGEKSPKDGSKQISNIMNGILKLAKLKRINDINEDTLKEDFNQYLNSDIDYEIFKNNLNLLFDTLNINASVLSKYLGYDPSYLSKIRNGVRRPTYLSDFIDAISKYIY